MHLYEQNFIQNDFFFPKEAITALQDYFNPSVLANLVGGHVRVPRIIPPDYLRADKLNMPHMRSKPVMISLV